MARVRRERGFSLIELLVVIVVIGILAGVAIQSMTATVKDLKRTKTQREMEMLSRAIVGDPSLTQNGHRSDFGYVGDVGAFPPNLQALYQNPGGLSTWNGPYIPMSFSQDTTGFKTDEWGRAYAYSGGVTITSTGGGTTLTKKIADAAVDYLNNAATGVILDAEGNPPGPTFADSIEIVITYPDGAGSASSKTYRPNMAGVFRLDSIPAGSHSIRILYKPAVDTISRYLTILPRNRRGPSYQFASAYFGSGLGGGTNGSQILRPDGAGSLTNVSRSGCAANYQCVAEVTADDAGTFVYRASNQFQTDVYRMSDPSACSGAVTGVTVHCRARREHVHGQIMPTVYVAGTQYNGPAQDLTNSWSDYSCVWTANPATGAAWTWGEIISLEAGVRLMGQNLNFPAYCTQVWVEVANTI